MRPEVLLLFLLSSVYKPPRVLGGFGDPGKALENMQNRYGKPCDCGGGCQLTPGALTIQTVNCGQNTAHLQLRRGQTRPRWVCKQKPQPKPPKTQEGGQCPAGCVHLRAVNSLCYKKYTECLYKGERYLVATLTDTYRGSAGGDWANNANRYLHKYHMLEGAGCDANKGEVVCWPKRAPLLISDNGGPTDQEKEEQAIAWVKQQQDTLLPPLPPPLKP